MTNQTMLTQEFCSATLIFEFSALELVIIVVFQFENLEIAYLPYMDDDVILMTDKTFLQQKSCYETLIFEISTLELVKVAVFNFVQTRIACLPYLDDDVMFDDRFDHVNARIGLGNIGF